MFCRRPAVSAMSTSAPLALAASNASYSTEALSAPVCWAMTGTSFATPHASSCSTAAARKVSPAASITLCPCALNRCANLPIVVVLPAPLTPTTKITKGLWPDIASGISRSASNSVRVAFSADITVSDAARSFRSRRFRSDSSTWRVASTPKSAIINCSSSASIKAGSSCFLPSTRLARPSES